MTRNRIREAVAEDAAAVAKLITELGYPTSAPVMRDRLMSILGDSNYVALVADSDGQVTGVAGATIGRYFEKDGLYAQLVVLVVSSAAQGRGIGSRLVEEIERWSASRGAGGVFVSSGLHRAEAHTFYERCGYVRTGFRFAKQLIAIG